MLNLQKLLKVTLFISLISLSQIASTSQAESLKARLVSNLNQLKDNSSDLSKLNFKRLPNSASITLQTDESQVSPFIIGGTTAPRSRYREYTLLITADNAGNITGFCGGTMIASDKALTAAHCAQSPARNTFLLPGFYSFNDPVRQQDIFEVRIVSVHPQYNANTFSNDVAVLTTRRNYSGPTAAVHSGTNLLARMPSTVIGTGLTSTNPQIAPDNLQEVQTPITSNSDCSRAWQLAAGIDPIQDNMVCAGFPTNGLGSCSGDSGGPLFIEVDGQRVIAGTVSFGLSQCEANRGTSTYARMSSMTDFIRDRASRTRFVELNKQNVIMTPIIDLLLGSNETNTTTPTIPNPRPNDIPFPAIPNNFEGTYYLTIEQPGDSIFDDRTTYQYTQLNSNIDFSDNFAQGISIAIDGAGLVTQNTITNTEDWSWEMSTARNAPRRLTVGTYNNVERFPFNDNSNGLSVSGLGSGCNQVFGQFRIFDVEYNGNQLIRLVADFERSCSANTDPLIGSIDFDASRSNAISPTVTPPQGSPNPSLPALTGTGGVLIVEGTDNTFIVGNQGLHLDNTNSTFSISSLGPDNRGLSVDIQTGNTSYSLWLERSSLDIDPQRDTRIEVGVYNLATRYPFNAPLAGLSFFGNGSGCNRIGGSFNIYQIGYSSSGALESLLADFVQNCGRPDSIRGSIQVNLPVTN